MVQEDITIERVFSNNYAGKSLSKIWESRSELTKKLDPDRSEENIRSLFLFYQIALNLADAPIFYHLVNFYQSDRRKYQDAFEKDSPLLRLDARDSSSLIVNPADLPKIHSLLESMVVQPPTKYVGTQETRDPSIFGINYVPVVRLTGEQLKNFDRL